MRWWLRMHLAHHHFLPETTPTSIRRRGLASQVRPPSILNLNARAATEETAPRWRTGKVFLTPHKYSVSWLPAMLVPTFPWGAIITSCKLVDLGTMFDLLIQDFNILKQRSPSKHLDKSKMCKYLFAQKQGNTFHWASSQADLIQIYFLLKHMFRFFRHSRRLMYFNVSQQKVTYYNVFGQNRPILMRERKRKEERVFFAPSDPRVA